MLSVIQCNYKSHANKIMDIYNYYVENTVATYRCSRWDLNFLKNWFKSKENKNFPIVGAIDENNDFIGFGSYDTFRPQEGYNYTVELSLYIDRNSTGKGAGNLILEWLINDAKSKNFNLMIGVIDSENKASIKLHEKFGFNLAGKIPMVANKLNNWLDVVFYYKNLKS